MKFPLFSLALVSAGLLTGPLTVSAQTPAPPADTVAATNAIGPRIFFPAKEFDFGKISMGQAVTHTFVVSNTGDQTLEISNVRPGCHCTTAGDWTHHIEPGRSGSIPLKFDSSGVHGDFTRSITVTANDKITPNQVLTLRGSVWTEIEVTPSYVYMNVTPDSISNASSIVHIYNRSGKPMTLANPMSVNKSFTATVKEIKPGVEFEMTVAAVPPLSKGNTGGSFTVATSLASTPVINISVMAILQPAIGVVPPNIYVPANSSVWTTNRITFASNKHQDLQLTDAMVCCDKRATVELKELTPGKVYQLVASLPPGFETPPGQTAQISVKSNFPEQADLVVPIRTYPQRPMPPVAPPRPMLAPPVPTTAPPHP